jgi:hypothetical protein
MAEKDKLEDKLLPIGRSFSSQDDPRGKFPAEGSLPDIIRNLINSTPEQASRTIGAGVGKGVRAVGDFAKGTLLDATIAGQLFQNARPLATGFVEGVTGTPARAPSAVNAQAVPLPGAKPDVPAQPAAPAATSAVPSFGVSGQRAQADAAGLLGTTAANRKQLLDAGAIQVIRGTDTFLETPLLSKFGHLSVPESQLQPGGLEGRRRLAEAGGFPAVAQSQLALQGQEARANAIVQAAQAGGSGLEDLLKANQGAGTLADFAQNIALARANVPEGSEADEALAAQQARLKQIGLEGLGLGFK